MSNRASYRPFVLQEHGAYRAGLHYDFRIMYPNRKDKLKSWAIPKARIPNKVGDKVLCVSTKDHDAVWLSFSGVIDTDQYGAGEVKIVQKGNLEITRWTKNVISFIAEGTPLNGKYSIVKFKSLDKKLKQETWLLIKGKDEK